MSRIIYIKCDRCGKQYLPDENNKVGYIGMTWKDPETDDLENGVTPYEHCDFCETCMKAISDFIESRVVIEQLARRRLTSSSRSMTNHQRKDLPQKRARKPLRRAGSRPKSRSRRRTRRRKKGVDTGKIKALSDAGWSKAKIADEMGISIKAVYYHLEKIKTARW